MAFKAIWTILFAKVGFFGLRGGPFAVSFLRSPLQRALVDLNSNQVEIEPFSSSFAKRHLETSRTTTGECLCSTVL